MSRALDKDTAAALQKGDPEAAFRAIADVLTEEQPSSSSSSSSRHLEIEFLGRGHPPLPAGDFLLRDGNAVAIPKLALVQAFLVARKMLQKHRAASASPTDTLLRATAVILLMDPEHLTAANTRKRLIQAAVQTDPLSAPSLLARELYLVDSLLTSHLHRHTKSPTLWSHRRWLISYLVPVGKDDDRHRLVRDVTEVVMAAGVRHPRNYYAWEHARWLVHWQRAGARADEADKDRADREDREDREKLVVAVRAWCYRNHTDTSGWSFLFFLLASLPQPPSAETLSPLYGETVAQVEQMAASLRWTGEAVWVFLRTAVVYLEQVQRRPASEDGQYARFRDTVSTLLATVDTASYEYQILQRAQEWCAASAGDASTT